MDFDYTINLFFWVNTNVLGHFLLFWNICIRHEKYWSGSERWTLTITVCGNGLMGRALTSPTCQPDKGQYYTVMGDISSGAWRDLEYSDSYQYFCQLTL